jgi:DNA-binding transcriptional ArsR family regulator
MFSNEKRLQILWKLSDKEYSVGELAKELNISIPNASQNLRIMKDKGAILERKDGHMVYYRVANDKYFKACSLIREAIIETQEYRSNLLKDV